REIQPHRRSGSHRPGADEAPRGIHRAPPRPRATLFRALPPRPGLRAAPRRSRELQLAHVPGGAAPAHEARRLHPEEARAGHRDRRALPRDPPVLPVPVPGLARGAVSPRRAHRPGNRYAAPLSRDGRLRRRPRLRNRESRAPMKPAVSIVIPVYNEEAVLPALFARLYPALDALGVRYEAIFVNDGTRDRSPALLRPQPQPPPP